MPVLPGVTIPAVAAQLQVHRNTVWEYVRAGRLAVVRFGGPKRGGIVLVTRASLRAFTPPRRGRRARKREVGRG